MNSTTTPVFAQESRLSQEDRVGLASMFSIDSRALAVVRILLASLLLVESLFLEWSRPRNPDGPIEFLSQYGFLITVPLAVMMLLGWKTRIAVVLTWLFYSMRIRGALVADVGIDVGDYVMTLALFWSIFLPMGRHLSLDSRRDGDVPVQFLSIASGAFLFQIFVIYFSAGLSKDMGEWVIDASAMQTILAHPNFETALGTWLLGFPEVLAVASVATVFVEVVGSLLVIFPGKSISTRRLILVPVFIAFHAGIALTMGIGLFPFVCMAIWLAFLPTAFWDRVPGFRDKAPATSDPFVDTNRWRNSIAGLAVFIAAVSNMISLLFYTSADGLAAQWQTMAKALALYQQWVMFSSTAGLS